MNVMQIGLGPIGRAVSRLLLQKSDCHLVAAVDIDPSKQGCDLGEVLGLKHHVGLAVRGDFPSPQEHAIDVAVVTTASTLLEVLPTVQTLIERGINVVTSAEELFYPYHRYPAQAEALDALARQHGVSVLGTGITPGFIMDTLVLVLTSVCQQVTRIAVTRVVNASGSRPSLQKKLGVGLTLETFAEQEAQHRVGIVGLVDSLAFLAQVMQWSMDDVKERLVPVITDKPLAAWCGQLVPGQVCGVRYVVKGLSHGKEAISFDLRTYLAAENARDTIYIEGTPALDVTIKSPDLGDAAVAGLLVNLSPAVYRAHPGLLTMLDVPMPHFHRQLMEMQPT